MIQSISRKLALLAISSLILFILIIGSLINLFDQQYHSQRNIKALIDVQSDVDRLRSQLWVFLQYNDDESLEQVYLAQTNLGQHLRQYQTEISSLFVLQKMNQNLSVLIAQEKELNKGATQETNSNEPPSLHEEAKNFLHSKYNMLVQSMSEKLLYIERDVLDSSTERQQSILIFSAFKLTIFSATVALIAFFIFLRFKHGYNALKIGMLEVGRGRLESKALDKKLDNEFQSLSNFFNQMKSSLQNITVTRDELQEEITRKTAQLMKQKDELLFLSEHDHLTGLLNRRAFERRLEDSINNSSRTNRKFALLFLDLDQFKQINDNAGHDAGDLALQDVARKISLFSRKTDFSGRLGGDEFVVCLTCLADFNGVKQKALKIRSEIEGEFTYCNKSYDIRLSLGISYFPDDGSNIVELMRKADDEMYQEKQLNII